MLNSVTAEAVVVRRAWTPCGYGLGGLQQPAAIGRPLPCVVVCLPTRLNVTVAVFYPLVHTCASGVISTPHMNLRSLW